MSFRAKKVLGVFLEKDNLKLLVYQGKNRLFAGQLTFAPEVVRDGFIADSEKFSSQVKIAFAQKQELREVSEVLLFISPDKAFTKITDSLETFVHGLPYFKEELVITNEKGVYVAFEKKLVEDLQKPFLEAGKKVMGIKSAANLLTPRFPRTGKYLLLIALEKEIVAVVAENGKISDSAVIKNEVFAARLPEFLANHNMAEEKRAYILGKFSGQINLELVSLSQTDIYELIINTALIKESGFKLLKINQKYLFLAGAILLGIILTTMIVKSVNNKPVIPETVSPVAEVPAPAPEPVKSDFPIEIQNGTLVTGEAGKLSEILKNQGYEITGTANATAAGFVATRLRYTPEVPEKILDQIKNSLLETYQSVNSEPVATFSGQNVIQIIIGKKNE